MAMPRVVCAETLDHLAASDPAAIRSRSDLRRIHRFMGTRGMLVRALGQWPAGTPLRILELGAGDGSLMLGVARALGPRGCRASLTLLDRQDLVGPATIAAFADAGWAASARVIDVFEWAGAHGLQPGGGLPRRRWNMIVCNLFLHHFEGEALRSLIEAAASCTDRFFACEPHRGSLALAASRAVGLIGANAVTREDAVLSVRAGFRDGEISRLWPGPPADWTLREARAGLFSHCFEALRRADSAPGLPAEGL